MVQEGSIQNDQYAHDELDDELAAVITSNESHEFVESAKGIGSLDDAYPEWEHEIDTDNLREVSYLATCADFGLSREIVKYRRVRHQSL